MSWLWGMRKKASAAQGHRVRTCGCDATAVGVGASSCGCNSADTRTKVAQVYGTGCKKCHALYENAVAALGAENVEYVTDMERIAAAGIMTLPALMLDGRIVSGGKLLSTEEIRTLLA